MFRDSRQLVIPRMQRADGASLVTYLPLGLITCARQIFNRLGLSGSLLRMIEKRHGADARAAALLGI